MYILFILVLKKVHTPLTYELTGSESSSVFFCIHNKSTQLAKKKKRKKKKSKVWLETGYSGFFCTVS